MTGAGLKSIVCRLTVAEYELVRRAAETSATAIEDFVATSVVRQACAMTECLPYAFAGRLFRTDELPDSWYEASTEAQLVAHLKTALRTPNAGLAGAMVIELLDFPSDWVALAHEQHEIHSTNDCPTARDRELVELVRAAHPAAALAEDARAWHCYKAILEWACERQA